MDDAPCGKGVKIYCATGNKSAIIYTTIDIPRIPCSYRETRISMIMVHGEHDFLIENLNDMPTG